MSRQDGGGSAKQHRPVYSGGKYETEISVGAMKETYEITALGAGYIYRWLKPRKETAGQLVLEGEWRRNVSNSTEYVQYICIHLQVAMLFGKGKKKFLTVVIHARPFSWIRTPPSAGNHRAWRLTCKCAKRHGPSPDIQTRTAYAS